MWPQPAEPWSPGGTVVRECVQSVVRADVVRSVTTRRATTASRTGAAKPWCLAFITAVRTRRRCQHQTASSGNQASVAGLVCARARVCSSIGRLKVWRGQQCFDVGLKCVSAATTHTQLKRFHAAFTHLCSSFINKHTHKHTHTTSTVLRDVLRKTVSDMTLTYLWCYCEGMSGVFTPNVQVEK